MAVVVLPSKCEPYRWQIEAVLSWLPFSADEYDAKAAAEGLLCKPGSKHVKAFIFLNGDTPIRPSQFGNRGGLYADRVWLLWLMHQVGLIESEDRDGMIWYARKKQSATRPRRPP